MSTTATAFDAKAALLEQIRRMGDLYISDFTHIPEDKVGVCPMGVARTALNFTAECAMFNKFVTGLATGNPSARPSDEERHAFYASIDTADKAKDLLKGSVDGLAAAIEGLDDEALFAPATAPWGEPTTVYKLAGMATMHLMYHAGQINYIQSLYGDAENHWG
jgi:hypothetical protein